MAKRKSNKPKIIHLDRISTASRDGLNLATGDGAVLQITSETLDKMPEYVFKDLALYYGPKPK